MPRERRFSKLQTAVLVAMALILGAGFIQPSVAHVTKRINHLFKHLDPRYYNAGETVGNADRLDGLDSSAFLQNQGSIKIATVRPWTASSPAVTIVEDFDSFVNFESSSATSSTLTLAPDLPVTLYGKSLRLIGVEVCYNAEHPNATLTAVQLFRVHAIDGSLHFLTGVLSDTTHRDDSTCRTYTGTPQVLGPNSYAQLDLFVVWTGPGSFHLTRTTLLLEPTDSEIAPLRQAPRSMQRRHPPGL